MSLRWQHYPRSQTPSELCGKIVKAFTNKHSAIDSSSGHTHKCDKVLSILAEDFLQLGFQIERGKKNGDKITFPLLFGRNGRIEKPFYPDGYQAESRYMLEVEAGSAITNHQLHRDLLHACICDSVDRLAVAVRNVYSGSDDFTQACRIMDSIFNSRRFALPLKEVLIIGY